MTHDRILSRLVERLRGTFGDFVAVRDLRRTRRVEGDAWCATLAVATSAEELILGEFDVGEDGTLTTRSRSTPFSRRCGVRPSS